MDTMVFYIAAFILIFGGMFFAGKYIKKLPSNIVKTINWISFGIAVISLILKYIKGDILYWYIFLASIIIYFLFYNYDSKKG
ncbi:MAG: hypothetical protein HZC10_03025 [Nitrospirae bacterium]|nr:hypothetical protein [Nitrospirota bacterium]